MSLYETKPETVLTTKTIYTMRAKQTPKSFKEMRLVLQTYRSCIVETSIRIKHLVFSRSPLTGKAEAEGGECALASYDKVMHDIYGKLYRDIKTFATYMSTKYKGEQWSDSNEIIEKVLFNFVYKDIPVYATIYEFTHAYGGSEEGGWYYDHYSHGKVFTPDTYSDARKIVCDCNSEQYSTYKYKHERTHCAFLEFVPLSHSTKAKPIYQ